MPDPNTWGWIAAGAAGAAFMWLVREYIGYIKEEAGAWRQAALKGATTTEKAAKIALREED